MIRIGEYQTLTISRKSHQGAYLKDEEGNEVLMPWRYGTEAMVVGDEMEVFVYGNSDDIEIATTEQPLLTVGQYAYLLVKDVNTIGAFCDFGVSKDLFIPFRNQAFPLRVGKRYVAHMYLDDLSDRLVGSTKLRGFLQFEADEHLQMGQEVELLVYAKTDMGYNVIVDQQYAGLVYKNEVDTPLHLGQQLKGYIKPLREDGKIDVSVHPVGLQSIAPNARKILDKLEENDGFLPFTDKSDAGLIRQEFGISKKLFKKALGALYKRQLITLEETGIYKAED